MNAPARTPKAGEAAVSIVEKEYHFIDAQRSAEIEEFRWALRSLSELACDQDSAEDGQVMLSRPHLSCLFTTLERSLGNLVGPEALPFAFLPEAVFIKGTRE